MSLGQRFWLHKKAEQELPGLEIMGYKVFGNDFTDVDLREELCHHSLTEYGKISGEGQITFPVYNSCRLLQRYRRL